MLEESIVFVSWEIHDTLIQKINWLVLRYDFYYVCINNKIATVIENRRIEL